MPIGKEKVGEKQQFQQKYASARHNASVFFRLFYCRPAFSIFAARKAVAGSNVMEDRGFTSTNQQAIKPVTQ